MLEMPELLNITPDNYVEKLEELYSIYKYRIFLGKLKFMGFDIVCRKEPLYEGKDECFWHLITKDSDVRGNIKNNNNVVDRNEVDFRRVERLSWCPYLLDHHMDKNLTCWEKSQNSKNKGKHNRVYLWDENNDYVIILAEDFKRDGTKKYQLITAFVTDKDITKKKFNKRKKQFKDPRF